MARRKSGLDSPVSRHLDDGSIEQNCYDCKMFDSPVFLPSSNGCKSYGEVQNFFCLKIVQLIHTVHVNFTVYAIKLMEKRGNVKSCAWRLS